MGHVTLKDGAKIAFEANGKGRPLVLLHGWAVHGGLYLPQIDELSRSHSVISLDLRGHRHSSAPDDKPTIEQLAGDLTEVMENLGIEDAIAVGWSMGAMVLWQALSQGAGDWIAGLVTIDMSPRLINDSEWSLGLARDRSSFTTAQRLEEIRNDWPSVVRRFVPKLFAQGTQNQHQDLIDRFIAEASLQNPQAMAALWESMIDQDFRPILSQLNIPTLVTYGERSQLYQVATSEFVAGHMPNATLRGFANSGHAPHIEEPNLFNEAIKLFSKSVPNQLVQRASS